MTKKEKRKEKRKEKKGKRKGRERERRREKREERREKREELTHGTLFKLFEILECFKKSYLSCVNTEPHPG